MKIAFCGAGGTGKTKALQALVARPEFAEYPVLKSASRTVFEDTGMTEEKEKAMTAAELWAFQFQIFRLKQARDTEFPDFVADRTVLDHYAYCLVQAGGAMPDEDTLTMETTVKGLLLTNYTHIFYFPVAMNWKPEPDGVRDDRLSYRMLIDSIITGYLAKWNIPHTEISEEWSPELRAEFISSHSQHYSRRLRQ